MNPPARARATMERRGGRFAGWGLPKALLLPICALAMVVAQNGAAQEPGLERKPAYELGRPPQLPTTPLAAESARSPAAKVAGGLSGTGGFGFVDLTNRTLAASFYRSVFNASENTPIDWTGNFDTCDPGDSSANFKDAVLLRINWYRAMAGVPNDVTFATGEGSYSDKAQDAALMMGRNGALSHNPPTDWACYRATGAQAAGSSNLSLGVNGWNAIAGQMRDNGGNNAALGHRRWLLYPQTRIMGTGDVPASANYSPAHALWVFDSNYGGPRPGTRETFVAWPPPGHVPYQVVYPRWSFSYPGADFSAATVRVSSAGVALNTQLETVVTGYGENTLAWVTGDLNPLAGDSHWPKPSVDTTYDVSIRNVVVGGVSRTFDYPVTIIDPDTGDTQALPITGPATIGLNGAMFVHGRLDFSESYQLRQLTFTEYGGPENAEDGGAGIVDRSNDDYPLISALTSASGVYSFHLAHSTPQPQSFELDRVFVVGENAFLAFNSRLGFATSSQVARVQISVDDGTSWTDVYSQAGTNSAGESSFSSRYIDLSEYVHRTARFRVLYDVQFGSYYPQTSGNVGFFIDDIEFGDIRELGVSSVLDLGAGGTLYYTPPAQGDYGLQVRAVPWIGFPGLDWGPVHSVSASGTGSSLCEGENVVVIGGFPSGQQLTCTATTSITTSGPVAVPAAANVRFVAPQIRLMPGFSVAPGASFDTGN